MGTLADDYPAEVRKVMTEALLDMPDREVFPISELNERVADIQGYPFDHGYLVGYLHHMNERHHLRVMARTFVRKDDDHFRRSCDKTFVLPPRDRSGEASGTVRVTFASG